MFSQCVSMVTTDRTDGMKIIFSLLVSLVLVPIIVCTVPLPVHLIHA